MFHWQNGIYFGRRKDGSVRVLKGEMGPDFPDADGCYDGLEFDLTIDPSAWASIVSSVSRGGEEGGRFYTALEFHGEGVA